MGRTTSRAFVMTLLRPTLLLVTLMLSVAAAAQDVAAPPQARKSGKWNGTFGLDGGTNFQFTALNKNSHALGAASAKIGYSTPVFSFDISTKISGDHKITGEIGGNIDIADNDTTRKGDASVKEVKKLTSTSKLNLGWKLNDKDRLKAWYGFSYDKSTPDNYNLSSDKFSKAEIDFEYTKELGDKRSSRHTPGISYEHIFPEVGGVLTAGSDICFYNNMDFSDWQTGNGKGTAEVPGSPEVDVKRRYRTTPTSDYFDNRMYARYTDTKFAGVKGLDMEFSFTAYWKILHDHMSAANYVGGEWRDSTSARENFTYRTFTLTPMTRAKYTVGIYKVDLTYSPEFFAYKLDGDSQTGKVNRGRLAHLVDWNNILTPWKNHSFTLHWTRKDERPDYLQICWFPRASSIYSNEIYVGNPDLLSSITTKLDLSYEFRKDRFKAELRGSSVLKPRKIASTYSNETIDGREYRVYTWVNGGNSIENTASLDLGWSATKLKANLSGDYTFYHGFSQSGKETKSRDWSVAGNVSYSYKTWDFRAAAKYQSGVTRTYYSITSLVDADIRIDKSFGKHFSAYILGSNLLDRPVTVKTVSEDEKQYRFERLLNYKRLLKLGVTYKF